MFGKNQVTNSFPDPEGSLMVNSLFYTIQGEGPDTGHPAIFLRLSRCNLRCHFCDTEFEKGEIWPAFRVINEIWKIAVRHSCPLVVITGGEPLLQNIVPVVYKLNELGVSVSVETAGTVWIECLDQFFAADRSINNNLIVCSPKTPKLNGNLIPIIGAFKYIIQHMATATDDGLPDQDTQHEGKAQRLYRPDLTTIPRPPIYVQPMDEGDRTINKANQELAAAIAMQYGYFLSMQIHKLVNLP